MGVEDTEGVLTLDLDNEHFPKPLCVKFIDGKMWELVWDFEYVRDDNSEVIKAPAGFIFDFASIPRWAWSWIGSPTDGYGPAACIHDYLCVTATWGRAKTDLIFLEAMRDCGTPYLKRMVMYYAVRIWSYF